MPEEKGLTIRDEFGATQELRAPETQSTAVAARERAAIEAMYIMAERHPRSVEAARVGILKDCQRPGFAGSLEEPVAMYHRKVGSKKVGGRWEDTFAEGPSIRLIETALRHWRNVYVAITTVYDDEDLRICRVAVMDLECNIPYAAEVNVPKRVEKRGWDGKLPKGREVISERLNSEGDKTYLVRATDAEVTTLQNALISKALRTNGQRLIPHDIIEEALAQIRATQKAADKADPDAAKRKLIDAFSAIGVQPDHLEEYLQHPLEQISPKELNELRVAYTQIHDGDTTWGEIMDEHMPEGGHDEQEQKMNEQLATLRAREAASPKKAAAKKPKEEPAEAPGEELEAHRRQYEGKPDKPAQSRRMKL